MEAQEATESNERAMQTSKPIVGRLSFIVDCKREERETKWRGKQRILRTSLYMDKSQETVALPSLPVPIFFSFPFLSLAASLTADHKFSHSKGNKKGTVRAPLVSLFTRRSTTSST